jgi:hypothetical protein
MDVEFGCACRDDEALRICNALEARFDGWEAEWTRGQFQNSYYFVLSQEREDGFRAFEVRVSDHPKPEGWCQENNREISSADLRWNAEPVCDECEEPEDDCRCDIPFECPLGWAWPLDQIEAAFTQLVADGLVSC